MVSTLAILALLGAGTLAGVASTVASLASVVSYPVLLALGLPPVSANVTNTVALVFTGAGAAAPVKTSATVLVTFALTGGSPSASSTG